MYAYLLKFPNCIRDVLRHFVHIVTYNTANNLKKTLLVNEE
jgi:hypothetical protein